MRITKIQLRQIIKEEIKNVLNEISVEDVEQHESLVARVAELLKLSKETDDVNKKETLMIQARELLNQATGITQASLEQTTGKYAQ